MKELQKVLKISAKYSFNNLRDKSPFFCKALNEKVFVTRIFWNHINSSKPRHQKEEVLKLATLSLVSKIFQYGVLVEKREEKSSFYKISLALEKNIFSVILIRNKNKNSTLFLFSCFSDTIQKK